MSDTPDFQFKTTPYAHQLKAFHEFKDRDFFALFADMGTGKSKIAIDVAAWKFLTGQIDVVLVIAPNNVHTQWIDEQLPAHCPVPYKVFAWRSGKAGNRMYRSHLQSFLVEPTKRLRFLAVNVEAFQSDSIVATIAEYVKNNTPFIIVDEATRIKNRGAKRTKTIHKLNKYGQRCILTGTPTAKSPFDLWSMMELLKANYFDANFFVFQHRYGVMMQVVNPINGGRYTTLIDERTFSIVKSKLRKVEEQRGAAGLMPDDYEAVHVMTGISERDVRFIAQQPMYTQFKRLDELKAYMERDVFSLRKEDCLDLPPKVYEKILVDAPPEVRRVYNELKKELLTEYEGKELSVANKVALTTRLMQITGGFFPFMREQLEIRGSERLTKLVGDAQPIGEVNAKMVALLDDVEEASDEQRIIVWAHFVPELKALYAALSKKYRCALYYGGTSTQDRDKIIADFKRGEYKVFIGNAQTAGFGLNLQNATLQYFYSNTFRTEERLQAEDRSHRNGVKGTVVIKDVIMRNTIDERVFSNIASGRNLNDYFKQASLKELLTDSDEEVQF